MFKYSKIVKKVIFYGSVFGLSGMLLLTNCEKNLTPVAQNAAAVDLQIEEVMVTEAWLKLSVQNLQPNQQAVVWRDSLEIFRSNNVGDTVIYDNELQPAHTYNYRAAVFNNQQQIANSQARPLTTMDTTSRNFSWEIEELETTYSELFDVAIINENDIWAVGEIGTHETDKFDSLGNWVPPYNAVHWDGIQWNLIRITVKLNYGNGNIITTNADDIKTVFSTMEDDIWFVSDAGGVTQLTGNNWIYHIIPPASGPGGAVKIWGTTSDNLYFAGSKGIIAKYNGQQWTRILTDTQIDFWDIWGGYNEKSGETEIIALGSLLNYGRDLELVKINFPYSERINKKNLHVNLKSMWFIPGKLYCCAGNGFYSSKRNHQNWEITPGLPMIYQKSVRGNAVNDIFIVGSFGLFLHFNGLDWKNLNGSQLPYSETQYLRVETKENIIAAIGEKGNKLFFVRGKR